MNRQYATSAIRTNGSVCHPSIRPSSRGCQQHGRGHNPSPTTAHKLVRTWIQLADISPVHYTVLLCLSSRLYVFSIRHERVFCARSSPSKPCGSSRPFYLIFPNLFVILTFASLFPLFFSVYSVGLSYLSAFLRYCSASVSILFVFHLGYVHHMTMAGFFSRTLKPAITRYMTSFFVAILGLFFFLGGGGKNTYLLLAFFVLPLTTHPC